MKPAPFEQFIKSLLDNTNCADALRNLAEKNIPLQGDMGLSSPNSGRVHLGHSINLLF
jgi:hypothetical protein